MKTKYKELSLYKFRKILQKKWFYSQFHPILSLKEKRILGLEALSRGYWLQKANRINPYLILNATRKFHREIILDDLWFKLSLENFASSEYCRQNLLLFININSSRIQKDRNHSEWILKQIEAFNLKPQQLVIEMVDSEDMDFEAALDFAKSLKQAGIRLAVDDLGVGYSNFERILKLEPALIKVDRSVINDICINPTKQSIFRSIIDFAHKIGSMVVAEGVENLPEIIQCGHLGSDLFQGYYFSHPLEIIKINSSLCRSRIEEVNKAYRSHMNKILSHKLDYHKRLKEAVELIEFDVLEKGDFDSLDFCFKKVKKRFSELDCFFILDNQGLQLSPTYGLKHKVEPFYLYNPSGLGADHSMKTYFISSLQNMDIFISDPYISLANGKLCKTIVKSFNIDDKWYHLCVDFMINREKDPVIILGL